MDTDDIAMPIRAEEQLNVFEKYPDVDVVGAWVNEFIDDISNIISVRKLPEWHDEILRFAQKRNPMNHPVVMFKKSAVVAAGGYQHFPFWKIIICGYGCYLVVPNFIIYRKVFCFFAHHLICTKGEVG